uniref:Right handed beta helix domain-containing protein n=1 Tax=Amphimedon queenslandica TaxID=400682 RepID=A0A1X7T2C3_AMPQE
MSLLLVVVLLFFSSSCSVSSGQYYVSDDCSSVTQSPCNPLSVYAGNMSQYNNTIFYFIGTSVINFDFEMDSVQNITLHGLDQSPTVHCYPNYNYYSDSITVTTSSHVSFSNLSFQQCNIQFMYSSSLNLCNVFDSTITSSVLDSVALNIHYYPPPVCYNELHHYSLTLTNVTVTKDSFILLYMGHGTSYNISVTINNINMTSSAHGEDDFDVECNLLIESLFSLYITNSSTLHVDDGFGFEFHTDSQESKDCNIKGFESQLTIVVEDCQFLNNGLFFHINRDYSQSCSIRDSDYGLSINGHFSTSAHISVIDTELVGNGRNEIRGCPSILLNNVTVTNSPSTGLVIIASVVTVENRLVFKNNTGVVGGGMAISESSIVALSSSANLEFIDNHATYKGGGIAFTFKGNTAGVAGNDIYGVYYELEKTASLKLANLSTSSDASAFAFCDPVSNKTTPIWYDEDQQSVFPGQPLKYNVALVGRSFYTASYSLTDGRITIEVNGTLLVIDKYINNCSLIEYTPKYIDYFGEHTITFSITTDTSFSTEWGISFILNECPIGFSVNSSGVCDCSVSRENVTCDINTLDITHNGLLWIGTYHTSTPFNANSTNPNACIINEDCLLYCSPNPLTFQFNHTDTQCVDNRGHRMCGSCTEGYSLLMGSNKCGHCHNNYMMIAWIALFAVMGVLLVVLLISLNLTVSVGTLNGLLFYANIVKLYEPVFSRKGALPVLTQ